MATSVNPTENTTVMPTNNGIPTANDANPNSTNS
jgi:hypothetical protein